MVIFYAREVWSKEGDRILLSTVPTKIRGRSMYMKQTIIKRKDERKEYEIIFYIFGKNIQINRKEYQPILHRNKILYDRGIFVG